MPLLLLCGCAASPYLEVGAGYKLNKYSDWSFRTENGGGRNPTARIEVGAEWDRGKQCALMHWSHIRDGNGFNNRPETYYNEIYCSKRWGGKN